MKLTIRSAVAGVALSLIGTTAFAQASATANGTAAAKIISPIAVSQPRGLEFGTLVIPATTGTEAIAATSAGAVTLTGLTRLSQSGDATPTSAEFDVTGQANYAFTVTDNANFTWTTQPSGATAPTVALAYSPGPYALDGTGNAKYYVGGTITVASTTTPGAYAGTFTATVAYQ